MDNSGCEWEFILGYIENRISMCAQVKFDSRFRAIYVFKYIRESPHIHSTIIYNYK